MRFALSTTCVLAGLTSCAAVGPAPQSKSPAGVSNVTILVGQRLLDEEDWEPLDEQTAVALEFDTYSRFEAVGFEGGFAYAEDSGADLDSEVWELYAGARKTFSLAGDRLHPYLSGGVSWAVAEIDADDGGGTTTLDDDSFGFYVRAGIYYTFGGGFNLGLDYRKLLGAEFEDSGVKVDGDFDQLSLGIGYSF